MTAADRSRWAHWFTECADQADDLSEDEKRGAHHLLDDGVVSRVAAIEVDADAAEALADHVRGRLDADIAERVL